jgi:hypothetical protein
MQRRDCVFRVAFAYVVTVMLPLAANARIAEYFAAIFVGIRSAQLTAMGDLEHQIRRVSRSSREDCGFHKDAALICEAWDQLTATRCAAGNRRYAAHMSRASTRGRGNRMAFGINDADTTGAGIGRALNGY